MRIVVNLGEDTKGNGGHHADSDNDHDDLDGSLGAGHGVGVDGTADGEVSFTGECEDGEDGGVLRHL